MSEQVVVLRLVPNDDDQSERTYWKGFEAALDLISFGMKHGVPAEVSIQRARETSNQKQKRFLQMDIHRWAKEDPEFWHCGCSEFLPVGKR